MDLIAEREKILKQQENVIFQKLRKAIIDYHTVYPYISYVRFVSAVKYCRNHKEISQSNFEMFVEKFFNENNIKFSLYNERYYFFINLYDDNDICKIILSNIYKYRNKYNIYPFYAYEAYNDTKDIELLSLKDQLKNNIISSIREELVKYGNCNYQKYFGKIKERGFFIKEYSINNVVSNNKEKLDIALKLSFESVFLYFRDKPNDFIIIIPIIYLNNEENKKKKVISDEHINGGYKKYITKEKFDEKIKKNKNYYNDGEYEIYLDVEAKSNN